LADRILVLGLMLVAYCIGFALIRWTAGFFLPVRPVPLGMSLVMIFAPLLVCVAFEWVSGLWGSTGLGSLDVVTPMFLAGLVAGAVYLGLRGFGPVVESGYPGRSEITPVLPAWGWATVGVIAVAFALYRHWPEPRPRLF
jgi:hypothetical protein